MRRIGLVSCTEGAGSRFFAANFACYLAAEEKKSPAVIEFGSGGLYDALGMDKRFAGKTFYPQGGPPNMACGVNWSLKTEKTAADGIEAFYERLRILDRTDGDVILCILNGLADEERELFLRETDVSFLLIDPLPSRLLLAYDFLKREAARKIRPVSIVNKMNPGVRLRQLESYLGETAPLTVPYLAPEEIYRAEYACRVPYESESAAALLKPAFRRIWRAL